MTDDELTGDDRALLDRRWHGLITIAPGGARLPAPRPVWFEVTEDGDVALFSPAGSPRVRRPKADPRAPFVVVRPPTEEDDLRRLVLHPRRITRGPA